MQNESKICQNCKKDFAIEPDDFGFYEKIKVSLPTFCPECRLIRRLSWRNEKSLNHRECGLCKRKILSIYNDNLKNVVYCTNCWWGDDWDATDYEMDIDPSKPFLVQLFELFHTVPAINLFAFLMINSEYCNMANDMRNCYLLHDGTFDENVSYGSGVFYTKDSRDVTMVRKCELCYELVTCINCYQTTFSQNCEDCVGVHFSHSLRGCNNCFGCVGLKKKQYCILNKQYSREEYEKLVPKIIKHMNDTPYIDKKGRIYKYGEFFPTELSPFGYNETTAQEYFPLDEEKANTNGYNWRKSKKRNYKITKNIENVPDSIAETIDSILDEVIACEHKGKCEEDCMTAFKILPEDLQFYRRMNLPLPRLCPNCRRYHRLKQRNPLKLWHRICMCDKKHVHHEGQCEVEFETSYAPDRPEIVYCEKCYQQEVY